ncbi:large conductance mechanosensitive channel protein MscL [Dermatobacter hominis]|uniref:large conductance mechanosensitive channel protein MscL n=1 Tax=Dermatobacter hominis TaxID=2884263 RepID=UPI001D10ABB1|nr:large conductance mechanosensitive channel protein MscL [Dermatobacter hominis]UDY37072.1 large conductance mechanosensitive channel protein MscL [Dermatobacter hominis]
MIKGFREFITRGNVVDLAVGVIIGAAFGAVVTSLTQDVIMPFIGAIIGEPSFEQLTFTIGDGVIRYGAFLTAVLNFLILAAAVYFFIVAPINHLRARYSTPEEEELAKEDRMIELLEQIARK